LQESAIAIIARWRIPPENVCGYSSTRGFACGSPTCRSSSTARRRATDFLNQQRGNWAEELKRRKEKLAMAQSELHRKKREAMLHHELGRLEEGLLFCLFDTPDRIQHMFWRYGEPDHPAHQGKPPGSEFTGVIEECYLHCDAVVGKALEATDDKTLLIVLSDHGFGSFQRGVHLNTWLHDNGYLALRDGMGPGEEAGDLLRHVDWRRTRAYALGLSGIYLNLQGREGQGTVSVDESDEIKKSIARGLAALRDQERGGVVLTARVNANEVGESSECRQPSGCQRVGDKADSNARDSVAEDVYEDYVERDGKRAYTTGDLVPGDTDGFLPPCRVAHALALASSTKGLPTWDSFTGFAP